MNKTIADAYKALKGDLNNSHNPIPETDRALFFSEGRRSYFCSSAVDLPDDDSQYICTVEEFNNFKESNMIKFDLNLGDKVVVNDVGEATIVGFTAKDLPIFEDKSGCVDVICGNTLYTLPPKQLSGFVNVYSDHVGLVFNTAKQAGEHALTNNLTPIACIDLSQFTEGHGLEFKEKSDD